MSRLRRPLPRTDRNRSPDLGRSSRPHYGYLGIRADAVDREWSAAGVMLVQSA